MYIAKTATYSPCWCRGFFSSGSFPFQRSCPLRSCSKGQGVEGFHSCNALLTISLDYFEVSQSKTSLT